MFSSAHSVVNNVYVHPQSNPWKSAEEFLGSLTLTRLRREFFLNRVVALNSSHAKVVEACLDGLVSNLGAEDPEVRRRSVVAVRYLKDLVNCGDDCGVSRSLLEGMNDRLGDFVDALVNRLEDSDKTVLAESIFTLKSFGPSAQPALERLIQLVKRDDFEYASGAADTISAIAPERIDLGKASS